MLIVNGSGVIRRVIYGSFVNQRIFLAFIRYVKYPVSSVMEFLERHNCHIHRKSSESMMKLDNNLVDCNV